MLGKTQMKQQTEKYRCKQHKQNKKWRNRIAKTLAM